VVDTTGLTADKGIAWLTSAIDRGQFVDAIEKCDLAAAPLEQSDPARAAVFEAAGGYMRVLKGDLKPAQTLIEKATQHAGTDATALAFVDLADAALRLARGDLAAAHERADRCGKQLVATLPVMASICQQLAADAANAEFGGDGSRAGYKAALALVENLAEPERKSTLKLALAGLDLDNGELTRASTTAAAVQKECSDRNAIGCDVLARILMSRVRDGEEERARVLLSEVKPSTIEAIPVKLAHDIALGEVLGILGTPGDDGVTGLDRIERARAEAEKQGYKLLEIEARLARLRVQLTTDDPQAKETYDDIVKLAKAAKLGRFTKLADAALKELSGPARATLAADGGLSDVREGSSDEP
jgi:ATP/maltotriose-dependent transcriptional regulator MalT